MMLRSRRFEEAVAKLWEEGKIFGEMHQGTGEEAIIAGVLFHLIPGDAVSTDHRSTPPFIMRGVNPKKLLLEFLGHPKGLCAGLGGHMHLYSKEHLIVSSGIVGASGPSAVGFALAADYKKIRENIAVAFFGEGAMNQGMLLESFNLASSMRLPVLFVCKDNELAITTRSSDVTGGTLLDRAKGFGIEGMEINGLDVEEVWRHAKDIIKTIRKKRNPFFIHAHCIHKQGHLLGDRLLRSESTPVTPLLKATVSLKGARVDKRVAGLRSITSIMQLAKAQQKDDNDPLIIIQKRLTAQKEQCEEIERKISIEMQEIMQSSMEVYQQEGV